jgi:hypothetical protein
VSNTIMSARLQHAFSIVVLHTMAKINVVKNQKQKKRKKERSYTDTQHMHVSERRCVWFINL